MKLFLLLSVILFNFWIHCEAIECYSGLKVIAGQGVGTNTINCENSGAQCYNMTANAANVYLDVVKTGCSLWRCMLAKDRCISTTFKNIPISLCCCSGSRCNAGGQIENKGSFSGNNAEPSGSNDKRKEIEAELRNGNLDDDNSFQSNRANRRGGWDN
ncbi:unnamed protein product [Auanema sp. JU1783]|nr:unnamed protein product [Auanema sp. JU1783]